jgi:flagellar hook-basal body complex protein FliE
MNPLSALSMVSSPDMFARTLPTNPAQASQMISQADMAELTSSMKGTGLNLESFRASRAATAKLPTDSLAIQDARPTSIGDTTSVAGGTSADSSTNSFSSLLGQVVGEVNAKQATATDTVQGLLSGKNVSVHQAMIAVEEANLSFQLMVQVRNKLLDSYQEMMRMQI